MKSIILPIENVISVTATQSDMLKKAYINEKGHKVYPLMEVNLGESSNDIQIARDNGSKVIYSTVNLENLMDTIISNFLFNKRSIEKSFFDNEIISTSNITFSFKKGLILKINEHKKILEGNDKDEFSKLLRKTMDYRNSFAHGKISYDCNNGVVLEYYRGEIKKDRLDDDYWTKLEESFQLLEKYLKTIFYTLGPTQ